MGKRIFEDLPSETRKYQKEAITAATELNYKAEVIYKLERAKTIGEISRVMITARKSECDDASGSKASRLHR